MNHLPKVVADLIAAQNNFDSIAYSHCFAETAIVFDEGKTHKGRKEIKDWIEEANNTYKTLMQPIEYLADNQTLKAEISGSFPGSPLVLTYQFDIKGEEIHTLKIT
ncbi:hypothetical protein J2X69_000356 [Algoriphagus sp. 4150]|uniref:nuclear transport factor 2 family protein n=1 Tax=Algoriphagus sp. 4150 TaxID=2817756 RepID=UPI0028655DEF|nr:nuclear transport factor 2 family protein [Algoriphagus sp. 4150]MDR7128028.1 hypothetical protein [Algoriphagus sp. 4150]